MRIHLHRIVERRVEVETADGAPRLIDMMGGESR
jgi:hypothetical protein